MKGKCRYCKCRVELINGTWQHDGIATLIHFIKFGKNPGSQEQYALAGPSKGGGS